MTVGEAFEALDLPPGSSYEEARSAFRRLAKKHHPDLVHEEEGLSRLVSIIEAYRLLKQYLVAEPLRRGEPSATTRVSGRFRSRKFYTPPTQRPAAPTPGRRVKPKPDISDWWRVGWALRFWVWWFFWILLLAVVPFALLTHYVVFGLLLVLGIPVNVFLGRSIINVMREEGVPGILIAPFVLGPIVLAAVLFVMVFLHRRV